MIDIPKAFWLYPVSFKLARDTMLDHLIILLMWALVVFVAFVVLSTRPKEVRQAELEKLPFEAADLAILFIIGLAGFFGFSFLISATYNLLSIPLPQPQIFPQGHFKEIPNPMNTSQNYHLTLNLYSITMSAQSDIDVYATVEPISEERQIYNRSRYEIPSTYILILDGTYCRQQSPDLYNRIHYCGITLKREPLSDYNWWNVKWQGSDRLNYTNGGLFSVQLAADISNSPRTNVSSPFIKIDDVSATTAYYAARESILLGRIAAAGTYAALIIPSAAAYIALIRYLRKKGFLYRKARRD